MSTASAAWFFAALNVHPPSALLVLAITIAIGVWTTSVSPGEVDAGLGMLLFVQMFLASGGFLVAARRGHFDPLLTGGGDRTGPLVWHWIVSVSPGAVGWLALSSFAYWEGSPSALSALAGGRAAAFFIVSAVAWAAGFALARGAAGVVWSAVLLGLLLGRADLLASSSPLAAGSAVTTVRQAATLVLCPFLLVGNHPAVAPGATCAAALLAAVLLLAVWRRARALDIYLVDRA